MYHRYMPMENGQYQRKNVPDSPHVPPPKPPEAPVYRQERPAQQHPSSSPLDREQNAPEKESARTQGEQNAPSCEIPFQNHIPILEKLLPGMDSGDILVLLILLFLLSEGNEDSTGVIMTLAIFLFLQ